MALTEGSYTWKITDGKLIQNILTAKNGDKFESDILNIIGLKWRLTICPNGQTRDKTGAFQVYLRLFSLPSIWKKLVVTLSMTSLETKSSFITMGKYKESESKRWPTNTLRLNDVRKLNPSKLTFIVRIKMIQIILKHNNEIYYHHPIMYNHQNCCEWNIDPKMMEMVKHSHIGKTYFSPIYDSMWILVLNPNGLNKLDKGSTSIELRLCALPPVICTFYVQWKLEVHELKFKSTQLSYFSFQNTYDNMKIAPFGQLKSLKNMKITLEIRIIGKYNGKNQQIEESAAIQWDQYVQQQTEDEDKGGEDQYYKEKLSLLQAQISSMMMNMNEMRKEIQDLKEENQRKDDQIKLMSVELRRNHVVDGSKSEEKLCQYDDAEKLVKLEAKRRKSEEIRSFFEAELNLPEFMDVIIENGSDDIESLNDLADDLKEMGIKITH